MTRYSFKKITVIALISAGAIFALFVFFTGNKEEHGDSQPIFDRSLFEQQPRKYMLDYISTANFNVVDKEFPSTDLAGIGKVYTTYYLPNNPYTVLNKIEQNFNHPEDNVGTFRAGILVFTKGEENFSIIWESKELFSAAASVGYVEFKDINNDSIDEIVLTIGQGARLNPALWIYRWDGMEFELVNPNPNSDSESERWMAGYLAELVDIDSDRTMEVVTSNEKNGAPIKYVYKFNGTEYYLWKENTEPIH